MSQEIKHTDDIFKNKFKDFNIEPAPAVWNNIESSVAAGRRKKLILVPLISIAASLLILAIPTLFFDFSPFSDKNEVYSELAISDSLKNNISDSKDDISETFEEGVSGDDLTKNRKDNTSSKGKRYDENSGKSLNGKEAYSSQKSTEDKISSSAKILEEQADSSNRIPKEEQKPKEIRHAIIVVPVIKDIKERSLLAMSTDMNIPTNIEWNNDYLKIRENIARINMARKTYDSKTRISIDMGQAGSASGSSYVYPTMENWGQKSDFTPLLQRSQTVTKPSIKLRNDFGISIELPLYKNFSLISGIRYLSFSDDKENGERMISSLGSVKGMDKILVVNLENRFNEVKQSFANIEIPLQLKYYIINKRLSIYVSGGMGFNFLVKNTAEISFEDGSVVKSETDNLTKTTYSGVLGLGISYNINNWMYLSIEPKYRHFFKSLSEDKAIEMKPDITNLSFGLGFKF